MTPWGRFGGAAPYIVLGYRVASLPGQARPSQRLHRYGPRHIVLRASTADRLARIVSLMTIVTLVFALHRWAAWGQGLEACQAGRRD